MKTGFQHREEKINEIIKKHQANSNLKELLEKSFDAGFLMCSAMMATVLQVDDLEQKR